MDESQRNLQQRFAAAAFPKPRSSPCYRELIVTVPGLGESYQRCYSLRRDDPSEDERRRTVREGLTDGGIIPGIKVDIGRRSGCYPGEKNHRKGLDGLRGRLQAYYQMGARFAKCGVITLGDGIPHPRVIEANAQALAACGAVQEPVWSRSSSRKCSWRPAHFGTVPCGHRGRAADRVCQLALQGWCWRE